MTEYPIVVREIGGKMRLGVEEADAFDADLREIVADAYERVDVENCGDGEVVGHVVASGDEVEDVRWSR
ncbi:MULTISPECIES: hypothetical protein [Halobacterium]|uniref:hypothetical protein n=1 Tax=Halobacterium TaxID=2239 RepID=UPI00073E3775|nr:MULTISPECIES: hypothetical protein [Halobacterium]MCG1002988.1 hypothetical protein [Halobacterium noricense]